MRNITEQLKEVDEEAKKIATENLNKVHYFLSCKCLSFQNAGRRPIFYFFICGAFYSTLGVRTISELMIDILKTVYLKPSDVCYLNIVTNWIT